MEKYNIRVGSDNHRPWENYSRDSLEYSAKEFSLPEELISELSDEELFNMIIKVSCSSDVKLVLPKDKGCEV